LLSTAPETQAPLNRFIFWISILLAAILLYLALRGLDWVAFFLSIRNANYLLVIFLLLWSSTSYFLRALRWRVLLNSQKPLHILTVFWANMTGYLGNAILPARAGEFLRAVYVSRRENIPVLFVLATGITERLIDLAALVLIGAGSLFYAAAFPSSVQAALQKFAVVAVAGVIFIFLLPLLHDYIQWLLAILPILRPTFKEKLSQMVEHFVEGLRVIGNIQRGSTFLFFTVAIWLMDGLGMVILAYSLHGSLSLAQSFLLIAALGISSAIPSTPGYVGVYQFVAVTVLTPFGFTRESALALILLSQIINLLLVSAWGGLGIWLSSKNILTDK
jgi:glycosyltransferase 2 family protein